MDVPHPPPAGAEDDAAAHGSSLNESAAAGAEYPPFAPAERWAFVTFAVALRSYGPTSSTSTSKTVRFSPSLVSYERCLRRPERMTRIPFVSDSATFSAA